MDGLDLTASGAVGATGCFVARNVADREPPFYDSAYGYDPLVHDPLGRFLSLLWRHSF
jgi:hypothetical protein